jgi:hypothetical protein
MDACLCFWSAIALKDLLRSVLCPRDRSEIDVCEQGDEEGSREGRVSMFIEKRRQPFLRGETTGGEEKRAIQPFDGRFVAKRRTRSHACWLDLMGFPMRNL